MLRRWKGLRTSVGRHFRGVFSRRWSAGICLAILSPLPEALLTVVSSRNLDSESEFKIAAQPEFFRSQHVLPVAVVRKKMAKSRLELRKMNEAAEAAGLSDDAEESPRKKKKATRKKAASRKAREKAPERKRAVWVLYSGSMKEEGRYPYDQKEAAEERLAILQGRGKKLYFMQMVKELITGSADGVQVIEPSLDDDDDDDDVIVKKAVVKDEDDLGDVEVDDADFEDDDDDAEGLDDDPDDD